VSTRLKKQSFLNGMHWNEHTKKKKQEGNNGYEKEIKEREEEGRNRVQINTTFIKIKRCISHVYLTILSNLLFLENISTKN
jgi:hypothetical protein